MQTLLNPRWLFLLNTLPLALLFFLYYGAYQLISTLLEPYNVQVWVEVGSSLAVLWVCNLVYALVATFQQRKISVGYAVTALCTYITFVYFYNERSYDIIPSHIPTWMLPTNMVLYVGTFIMPTLAHALLVLVIHSTKSQQADNEEVTGSFIQTFLSVVLPPVFWFLFIILIIPLWKPFGDRNLAMHTTTVFVILMAVVFLFGVSKLTYSFMLSRVSKRTYDNLFFYLFFGIFLPIVGLLLNDKLDNFFGNFTNEYFYLFALLNGMVLAIPESQKPQQRLGLFVARAIMLPFILYFFLIFLPYFPFAILAILAIGLGLLMLLPLLLFIMQTKILADDFEFLYLHFPKPFVLFLFAISLSVLPFSVSFSFLQDRWALYEALDYVYSPKLASTQTPTINQRALKSVINEISQNKDRRRWRSRDMFGNLGETQTPFLSLYYNWLVMDNLTVSDNKLALLEKIFLGQTSNYFNAWRMENPSDSVLLTNLQVQSTYDTTQQAWRSWLHFEVTNKDTTSWQQGEFKTKLDLPEGCFIADTYLWIEKEKVHGLLAEKKSALWIYQQITSARRDPAIWHYTTGNEVVCNIFPVAPKETRKAGVELLHKNPLPFTFHQKTIWLGDSTLTQQNKQNQQPYSNPNGDFWYFSAATKKQLATAKRQPFYHLIIDCSKDRQFSVEAQQQNLQQFLAAQAKFPQHATALANAKITFVNAYATTIAYNPNWQQQWKEQDFSGGFFLERAMQQLLYQQFAMQTDSYPIVIVLSNENGIITQNFADYRQAFPETDRFYYLQNNGLLHHYSLLNPPKENLTPPIDSSTTIALDAEVLRWQIPNQDANQNTNQNTNQNIAYLPIQPTPSTWLNSQKLAANPADMATLQPKTWQTGLILQGQYQQMVWQPEKTDDLWLPLVKNSFAAQIMTPLTSFISLENEAQRLVLKNKQQEVLNAKKSLDIAEATDIQRMSEPAWWLCLLLLLVVWGVKKKF